VNGTWTSATRTIAIALDAFEWWYAEQLIDDGKLPNLAALRSRGASARLANHVPYRSELSWTRLLSGREPIAERRWPACVVFDPSDYSARTRAASVPHPFYADVPGPVIAFDLIHGSLADGVDGVQVTAWGSHSPQYPRASCPAGLLREIDDRFGVSPAAGNDVGIGWYDERYVANLRQALETATRTRADIVRWLMDRQPDWRLLVTAISEVHGAGHMFWHGVDRRHAAHEACTSGSAAAALEAVCTATDAALGRILDGHDDANVVVFALHGMMPADDVAAMVLLPDLLHRRATGRSLLRPNLDVNRWRRTGCPPITPAPGEHWGGWMRAHFADGLASGAVAAARRHLSPAAVAALRAASGRRLPAVHDLAHVPPAEQVVDERSLGEFERDVDYQVASWYRPHWPSMPAFALPTFADGHIRINLRGRERDGVVAPDDYEREVAAIFQLLRDCRDVRTGAPAVDDILWLRRDDPFDPDGPSADLLVVWRDGPDAIEHPELGVVGPIPALRTGYHSPNGFAILAGPDVPRTDLGVRPVDDLTATIVALAGGDPASVPLGEPWFDAERVTA
jgi:predicted AlkP superfamily phosphohydrolase/phosphomutase